MLKPFFIKKKNIDNRLVPVVTAADAGKVLGVTEDGKIAPVEGGGGADFEVVYFTIESGTPALSKSYAEMIGNGEFVKNFIFIMTSSNYFAYAIDAYIRTADNSLHVDFFNGIRDLIGVTLSSENVLTVTSYDTNITLTPQE